MGGTSNKCVQANVWFFRTSNKSALQACEHISSIHRDRTTPTTTTMNSTVRELVSSNCLSHQGRPRHSTTRTPQRPSSLQAHVATGRSRWRPARHFRSTASASMSAAPVLIFCVFSSLFQHMLSIDVTCLARSSSPFPNLSGWITLRHSVDQVWVRLWVKRGSVVDQVWIRCGSAVDQVWVGCGSGVDQMWIRCGSASGSGVDQVWIRCGSGVGWLWISCGSGVDQAVEHFMTLL